MQLLAGTDTDFLQLAAGKHGLRQIGHAEGRDLADKGFSALRLLQRLDHQLHALRQADPEAGHAHVRDGKLRSAVLDDAVKQRDDGTAASGHVAVADDGETDILGSGIGVRRHKKLVAHQLGTAVQVDRIHRLVRGQGDHLLHIGIQRRVDNVLRAIDIGADRLVGIVLTGRYLL